MLGHVTSLDALPVVTHDRDFDPEVVLALLPAPANVGHVLGFCRGRAEVEGAHVVQGGRRWGFSFNFESIFGSEHTEHDIVSHHIKVPRDHGSLVCVLDENFMDLRKLC